MDTKRLKEVVLNYLYNIATMLSQAINTIVFLGDPDESISSRIGKSLRKNGEGLHRLDPFRYAPFFPWPGFMRRHFRRSIEPDRGKDGALTRQKRY